MQENFTEFCTTSAQTEIQQDCSPEDQAVLDVNARIGQLEDNETVNSEEVYLEDCYENAQSQQETVSGTERQNLQANTTPSYQTCQGLKINKTCTRCSERYHEYGNIHLNCAISKIIITVNPTEHNIGIQTLKLSKSVSFANNEEKVLVAVL